MTELTQPSTGGVLEPLNWQPPLILQGQIHPITPNLNKDELDKWGSSGDLGGPVWLVSEHQQ